MFGIAHQVDQHVDAIGRDLGHPEQGVAPNVAGHGPIPSEVENYAWWQRRRISVKPGLTCVWQVWGRSRVSFKRWVEMDLFYIDNWSLWLDVKLIAHTFRAVLKGTGM